MTLRQELQRAVHRNSIDFTGLLALLPRNRSATAAATARDNATQPRHWSAGATAGLEAGDQPEAALHTGPRPAHQTGDDPGQDDRARRGRAALSPMPGQLMAARLRADCATPSVPSASKRTTVTIDEDRPLGVSWNIPGTRGANASLIRRTDRGFRAGRLRDCAACHHVALLIPDFLLRLGLSPQTKVLDLTERVRCRGCRAKGRAIVSIKWRSQITSAKRRMWRSSVKARCRAP
jgi:hypothetical protein